MLFNGSHPKDSFSRLDEDYANWRREESPESSSTKGLHEYDDKLNMRSIEDYKRIKTICQGFGQRAKKLHEKGEFKDDAEKYYLEVIQLEADYCSQGIDKKGYLMSELDFRSGIQAQLPRWFARPSFFKLENIEDYDAALSRLKMIPKR